LLFFWNSSPLLSAQMLKVIFKPVFCWKYVSCISDVDRKRIIILGFCFLVNVYRVLKLFAEVEGASM